MTNTEGGEGGVLKKVSRRMEKLTNDGHCNRSVIIIMIISSKADENRARGAIDLTRAARRRTTKREDHLWPPIVGQQRLILGFMIYTIFLGSTWVQSNQINTATRGNSILQNGSIIASPSSLVTIPASTWSAFTESSLLRLLLL